MKRKASGIVIALTLLLATATLADFPAGPADDVTTSLGSFRIMVAPKWRAALAGAGYPGYNATSHKLQSPDLYDGNTKIGRSAQHLHGDATDMAGAVVGTAGRIVSDASFTLQPPGFQGPNGEHEVHTNVETLYMSLGGGGSAPFVKAGTAASTFVLSPGEVESKPGDGFPDFPAESFFDVFVEVGLPMFPVAGAPNPVILKNTAPLLVQNDDLTAFPPRVVYIHGNSAAVPVVFRDANPGQWTAGEKFGDLILAGHGLNFDSSRSDVAEFDSIMAAQAEIPVCACPCAGDPQCDSVIADVRDVTNTVAVAFRGAAPTVDPDCPRERTDVNCSGVTDVIDVTKVVAVAFRGGNPATEFCDPCA